MLILIADSVTTGGPTGATQSTQRAINAQLAEYPHARLVAGPIVQAGQTDSGSYFYCCTLLIEVPDPEAPPDA